MRQIKVDSYEKLKEVKKLFKESRGINGRMLYDLGENAFNRIIYFFPAKVNKRPEEDEKLIALIFSRTASPGNAYADFRGFILNKATRVPKNEEKKNNAKN